MSEIAEKQRGTTKFALNGVDINEMGGEDRVVAEGVTLCGVKKMPKSR